MSEQGIGTVIATINVAPAAEERLIDWLLGRDDVAGFTSYVAYGHGASHDDLTVAEQVTGRQRRVELKLELPADALEAFLAALLDGFAGTDLYYYVTPAMRSGHLRRIEL
jgi:hypothetical protein